MHRIEYIQLRILSSARKFVRAKEMHGGRQLFYALSVDEENRACAWRACYETACSLLSLPELEGKEGKKKRRPSRLAPWCSSLCLLVTHWCELFYAMTYYSEIRMCERFKASMKKTKFRSHICSY